MISLGLIGFLTLNAAGNPMTCFTVNGVESCSSMILPQSEEAINSRNRDIVEREKEILKSINHLIIAKRCIEAEAYLKEYNAQYLIPSVNISCKR